MSATTSSCCCSYSWPRPCSGQQQHACWPAAQDHQSCHAPARMLTMLSLGTGRLTCRCVHGCVQRSRRSSNQAQRQPLSLQPQLSWPRIGRPGHIDPGTQSLPLLMGQTRVQRGTAQHGITPLQRKQPATAAAAVATAAAVVAAASSPAAVATAAPAAAHSQHDTC